MTTVTPLTDFPDSLSPMVVKELRQGLRTRLFGGMMLALHALLVFITLMAGSANESEAKGLMDGLIILMLCGVFPFYGISALAGEVQANTMDMLVLTRLSTWRIVFGKWAAIVVQSLLVTISVVPYLVARYVYGGSDVIGDLQFLLHIWLISIVLTAGVVALSTQKQFWLRLLILGLPMMVLVFFSSLARAVFGIMGGSGSFVGGLQLGWLDYLILLLGVAWLVFALLSFGATRIAPASSLLPVTKRLVNLTALVVIASLVGLRNASAVAPVMTLILIVASLDALMDDVHNLSSLYLPFYRRGWLGRLASWFLAPGWMHGYLYSLLLFGLGCGVVAWLAHLDAAAQLWLLGCGVWQAAFFAHILAIQRQRDYLGALFAGFSIEVLLSFVILTIVTVTRGKNDLEWLLALMPWNTMAIPSTLGSIARSSFELGLMVSVVWPLLLALPAWLSFLRTRAARVQARQLIHSAHE